MHDTWVVDKVLRILLGSPVTIKIARWSDILIIIKVDVFVFLVVIMLFACCTCL